MQRWPVEHFFYLQKGTCSTTQVPFCEEKSVQLVSVAFSEVTSYKIHILKCCWEEEQDFLYFCTLRVCY